MPARTINDLARQFKRIVGKSSKTASFTAVLGNAAGEVESAAHPGFVHLHSPNGQYLGEAINNAVAPRYGALVTVGESPSQPGVWRVLGAQDTGVGPGSRTYVPNAPPHNLLDLSHGDSDGLSVAPVEGDVVIRNDSEKWKPAKIEKASLGTNINNWYESISNFYAVNNGGALPPGYQGGGVPGTLTRGTAWHTAFGICNGSGIVATPAGTPVYTAPTTPWLMCFVTHIIFYDCAGSLGSISFAWGREGMGPEWPGVDLGVLPDFSGGYTVYTVNNDYSGPYYGDQTNVLYLISTSGSEVNLWFVVELTNLIYGPPY